MDWQTYLAGVIVKAVAECIPDSDGSVPTLDDFSNALDDAEGDFFPVYVAALKEACRAKGHEPVTNDPVALYALAQREAV